MYSNTQKEYACLERLRESAFRSAEQMPVHLNDMMGFTRNCVTCLLLLSMTYLVYNELNKAAKAVDRTYQFIEALLRRL